MSNETPPASKPRRFGLILFIVLGLALLAGSLYFLKKFERDRQSAMNFETRPIHTHRERSSGLPVTRTYTQKEIEEARKAGKPLPGLPPQTTLPNSTGQDAVQRSLRTLDEINRINEMNRRLIEQQQRQQK